MKMQMRYYIALLPLIAALLAYGRFGNVDAGKPPGPAEPCGAAKSAPAKTEKPLEPPGFWVDMVNDEKLDTWRRGLAIYFLFDRHVKRDATLGELAGVLKGSKWINKDTVGISSGYMGPDLPFDYTYGDTMIAIDFFPQENVERQNKDCVVVFVNVTGKILPQDFVSTLMDPGTSKHKNTKIKESAVLPRWETYNRRIR